MNSRSSNSHIKIRIIRHKVFGNLVIGYCLLFCYLHLSIGLSAAYALNLERIKIYFLQGDYKSAITEGEKIIAATGQSHGLDELYYILGLSYLKDGNFLRASDIFEIILKEFGDSRFKEEAKLALSDTYFLSSDFNKAQDCLLELLKANPHTKLKAEIYYRLSQIGFKKGDTGQGKEYLEKLRQEFPLNTELRASKDIYYILPDSPSTFYYTVQVGSFSNSSNARNLTERLVQKGYPAYIEEIGLKGGEKSYRVRVGKFSTRIEAASLENKLSQEGYPTKIYP